jgi:hypothetical protein
MTQQRFMPKLLNEGTETLADIRMIINNKDAHKRVTVP